MKVRKGHCFVSIKDADGFLETVDVLSESVGKIFHFTENVRVYGDHKVIRIQISH